MGQFNGNELHRNNGGGSFTKITSPFTAGVAGDYTYAVAWGDMDGDGDLVRLRRSGRDAACEGRPPARVSSAPLHRGRTC